MSKIYLAVLTYVGDDSYITKDQILKAFTFRKTAAKFVADYNYNERKNSILSSLEEKYIRENESRIPSFNFNKLPKAAYSYFAQKPDYYTDGINIFTFAMWDKNIRLYVLDQIRKEASEYRKSHDNEKLQVSPKRFISYKAVLTEIELDCSK